MVRGEKVLFAGHIITGGYAMPNPAKVAALAEFPAPTDLTSLRSFLGMAQTLASYVPDMAHMTDVLRLLLKKGTAYVWLAQHEEAFLRIKALLTSHLVVHFYDPALPTELVCDASRLKGLGFALMQRAADGRPRIIQCGSRTLLPAESRYATIELECLAVQWATHECRFYLTSAPQFSVATDHKPLLGIFAKPLTDVTNGRLLRFREKLAPYSFAIRWLPGKDNLVADALSRAPVFSPAESDREAVVAAVAAFAADDPALQPMYDAARADPDYASIVAAVVADKACAQLPPLHAGRAFRAVWNDLSVHEDTLLVYAGDRIVVPAAQRAHVLRLLHRSHAGAVRMKQLAQQLYYWPSMNAAVKSAAETCVQCQVHRPSQPPEPLQMQPVPDAPFMSVATDLFEHAGRHYILLVDRFSGYPLVAPLSSLSTSAVLRVLDNWFVDIGLGYPARLQSDNGPQFRTEFANYCAAHHIKHVTSSPFTSRSNGGAERHVGVCQQLMRRTANYQAFKIALIAWRNTPKMLNDRSPSELFFGRRQRHGLPALPTALAVVPSVAPPTKQVVPTSGILLPPLHVGQRVRLQHPQKLTWAEFGRVIEVRETGRSYLVGRDGDSAVVRNRRLLRPALDPVDAPAADGAVAARDADAAAPPPPPLRPALRAQSASPPQLRRSTRLRTPTVRFASP